jgi:hypothetical protein
MPHHVLDSFRRSELLFEVELVFKPTINPLSRFNLEASEILDERKHFPAWRRSWRGITDHSWLILNLICLSWVSSDVMMRHNEASLIDPTLRVSVKICDRDSTSTQAEEIFVVAQSDVISKRLFEVAWEEYRSQRKYVVQNMMFDVVIIRSLLTISVTLSLCGHTPFVSLCTESS